MEYVEVKLSFVNGKGDCKNVRFYLEKLTHEALFDESVSEEERQTFLVNEYHEYAREQNRKRKFIQVDEDYFNTVADESEDLNNIGKYDDLHIAISMLTDRQKEFIRLKFYENKSQEEIARMYGISKQSVCDSMRRIYASLKKHLCENGKSSELPRTLSFFLT